jgi:hypothetical protein
MGTKRLTIPRLIEALKRLDSRRTDSTPRSRKGRSIALPPVLSAVPLSETEPSTAPPRAEATSSDQTMQDVYWILRLAVGGALDERIEFYRKRLLQLGVGPFEVERRIACLRPILNKAFGRARDRSDGARRR